MFPASHFALVTKSLISMSPKLPFHPPIHTQFRSYELLRREHDAQIIRMAMEAGLRISPEQWSSLLYGIHKHKSDMQSIIDKVIVRGCVCFYRDGYM